MSAAQPLTLARGGAASTRLPAPPPPLPPRRAGGRRRRGSTTSAAAAAADPAPSRRALLAAAAALAAAAGAPERARAAAAPSALDGQGVQSLLLLSAEDELTFAQRAALEANRRTQRGNSAPPDFPAFARDGYNVAILASEGYIQTPEGLVYKDFAEGAEGGAPPLDGEQVVFDYSAYNENGALIDSTYRKGEPAATRIGIAGLIPGFELGIRSMRPGGKRRVVVPPGLGPPVGPATFFSAKQYEVFDVELRAVRACARQTAGMFSTVVCS